jgi:glycosyltransferase involved in cell wall biosynthesis
MSNELVSIVVPAYNAGRTIARTLDSALAQTYPHIEIVVADDGSKDDTAEIVHRYAAADSRVRLVQQPNQGVAAARNTAIRHGTGSLVAPLDADDLWLPTKLEKQVARMAAAGPDVGLVYTLFRVIDPDDRLLPTQQRYRPEGWVFLQQSRQNFVANGSSILVRRSVMEEFGGYTTGLRALGLEGCEDFHLQMAIATRYTYAAVPEYLVGYRKTPRNMSSFWHKMALSRRHVIRSFLERSSGRSREVLQEAVDHYDLYTLWISLKRRELGLAARTFAELGRNEPVRLARTLAGIGGLTWLGLTRKSESTEIWSKIAGRAGGFLDTDPTEPADRGPDPSIARGIAKAARVDAEIGPTRSYITGDPEPGCLARTEQRLQSQPG